MVVNWYLSAAGLIYDRNFRPVAETAFSLDGKQVDIFYHHIIFDYVVGDVISDLVDVYIVADYAIVDGCVADPRWLCYPAAKGYFLSKYTQFDFAGKVRGSYCGWVKTFGNLNV
jgi:hypothetical protein